MFSQAHRRLYSTKGCLTLKVIFHQKLSSIEGISHRRSSSKKVIFHYRLSSTNAPSLDNNKNPPTNVILLLVTETNLYQVPREIHDIEVIITMVAIMPKQISL